MFISLPFILIASQFRIKGGNFIYTICMIWARIWYFLIGVIHEEIYEAQHDKNSQYIFVANHISYMDIPALVSCIHQPFRVLGKYEMVKVPVFGWIYRAAVILVDRSSPEKKSKSFRALRVAVTKGISIFIFPEGTFNETGNPLKDFYDGAFRIAIETKTTIKPVLLIDTVERLHYKSICELTPGKSRVVYLDEIRVESYTIAELSQLKQQVYHAMEKGLKKYSPRFKEN